MKHMIKQLSNNTYSKELAPLILITFISVIIWYGGASLTFSNFTPFAQPEKRFYLILLMFLTWFLKINFFTRLKTPAAKPKISNPEFNKKLQTLEGRFSGAMAFLKKTMITKHNKETSLINLPWYLLVGTSGSGKTTLMANAGINFILSKQFKNTNIKDIPSSDICDWWVTRETVLIDVPGSYLNSKPSQAGRQPAPFHYTLWHSFLNLLKKYRGKNALRGVIIALSLPDLLNPQQNFHDLKQRISEIRNQFGSDLTFYITITKCDKLPGFIDFFNDSSVDELAQAWGITIPTLKENETLVSVFTNRFNALIKRLNKQLIWRLHQERNNFSRPQIKDFPLQIERLKESMITFIKNITLPESHFNLQGIYLTSAVQHPEIEKPTPIQNSTALQLLRNPVMPCKAYFVRQFFLQGLLNQHDSHVHASSSKSRRPLTYALFLGIAVLMTLFFAQDIHHSVKQTYAIQDGLAQYHTDSQQANQQGVQIDKALPLLNALQQASINSSHSLLLHSDKAQQSAHAAYQQALQTIVLTQIKNNLEKFLQHPANKNPTNLYATLEAYLMLGDKDHLQPEFITSTLKQISPALFNNIHSEQIAGHIHAAFNSAWQPAELDSDLISNARKQLTSLSALEVSYIILKNTNTNNLTQTISLGSNEKTSFAFAASENLAQIRNMYTGDYVQPILDKQINIAATDATQGNWVLGGYAATFAAPNTELLAEQTRSLYLTDYAATWEHILSSFQLFTPKNLSETDVLVEALSRYNSPLNELLKAIHHNTSFAPVLAASPKLAALNAFMTSTKEQQSLWSDTTKSLVQLHSYLQSILTSNDVGKSAWQASSIRMTNNTDALTEIFRIAALSPEPLHSWLSIIGTKSWQYTLAEASHYIEAQWQDRIVKNYKTNFADRFPFYQEATKEVSLADFTNFLGTQGTYTNFYKTFLQSFIDTSEKEWKWKTVNNEKMLFSAASISQLQNIDTLQHALFNETDTLPAMKFVLQPIALEKNTKSIQLNIAGQSLLYNRNLPTIAETLNWPGDKDKRSTILNLLTAKNQTLTNTYNGDWGLFRLIQKSQKKAVNQKELQVNFDIEGHNATYLLFTLANQNPFLLNFQLPDQL
ncbi:MAG: type VI secretion system membrane subunit TssM [Gammaproteobacteria bacterium]|nr:type VI secretion system membrane subunit TssM [Gammaproteobacteria bacterium]